MSASLHLASLRPAPTAAINRLLLFCRFDYSQKVWGLAATDIPRGRDCVFPGGLAALTTELSRNLATFSDPSLGGTKPSKPIVRRTEVRSVQNRSLGKTKQP